MKVKQLGSAETRERNMKIKRLKDAGWTYKEIAEKFGISISRASQIVKMEELNMKNGFR